MSGHPADSPNRLGVITLTTIDTVSIPLADQPLVEAGAPRGLLAGTSYAIKAVVGQRELLLLLVKREIKARYKDSSLGFLWSLLRPLTMLLIYYIAIGKFLSAERQIPNFAIFVFTGLTAWGFFSEIVSSSTTSILTNAGLVKKVYLPREIFPLASVGAAAFNFGVQMIILLLATVVTGSFPLSLNLLYWPLAVVVLVFFATGVGLILAAANVYLRDMQHLVEVMLLILFWASPIVYGFATVDSHLKGDWLEQIYLANPVTLIILAFQKAFWNGSGPTTAPPDLWLRLAIVGVVSMVLLWVGQRVFARLEGNFAQEL